jgi:hypothetical protein
MVQVEKIVDPVLVLPNICEEYAATPQHRCLVFFSSTLCNICHRPTLKITCLPFTLQITFKCFFYLKIN